MYDCQNDSQGTDTYSVMMEMLKKLLGSTKCSMVSDSLALKRTVAIQITGILCWELHCEVILTENFPEKAVADNLERQAE